MKHTAALMALASRPGMLLLDPMSARSMIARASLYEERESVTIAEEYTRQIEVARVGSLAVVAVRGATVFQADWIDAIMGAIDTDAIVDVCGDLAEDPTCSGVLFDLNCPGGTVAGCDEVAAAVSALAAAKPCRAIAHGMIASAAWFIAGHCEKVYATETAMVGSIGTLIPLYDDSKMFADLGIEAKPVSTDPERKPMCYPGVPLSETFLAEMQADVDQHYRTMFVPLVAKGRRMSEEAVVALGARCFTARDAKAQGLVDEVASLDAAISDFAAVLAALPITPAKVPTMSTETPAAKSETPTQTPAVQAAPSPATFAELSAAFGDDAEFIHKAQKGAMTMEQARSAYTDSLKAKLAEANKRAADAESKAAESAKKAESKTGADPAAFAASGTGGEHEFMRLVKAEMESSKAPIGECIARVAGRNPALHQQFIADSNAARVK